MVVLALPKPPVTAVSSSVAPAKPAALVMAEGLYIASAFELTFSPSSPSFKPNFGIVKANKLSENAFFAI